MKKLSFRFWLNLLIYVAIIFLIVVLIRFDFVKLKNISINPYWAALALIVLFISYLVSPMAWKVILSKHKIKISYREAYVAEGMPIFAKYLPGKFMVLIGRAGFVSLKGHPLTQTSVISFKSQMISLISNLLFGSVSFLFINHIRVVMLPWMALLTIIIVILYVKPVYHFTIRLIHKIFKSKAPIPYLALSESLMVFIWYIVLDILWGLGFMLLCLSAGIEISLVFIPVFSLATSVSIMAFLFPGGLGVREGVLVYFLYKWGIPVEQATIAALLSRLWFLSGEIYFFSSAFILKKITKTLE